MIERANIRKCVVAIRKSEFAVACRKAKKNSLGGNDLEFSKVTCDFYSILLLILCICIKDDENDSLIDEFEDIGSVLRSGNRPIKMPTHDAPDEEIDYTSGDDEPGPSNKTKSTRGGTSRTSNIKPV
jgi:hypothetical protein